MIFSGLTIVNYIGFTWQASWGKASLPHQTWCIASALQFEGSCIHSFRPLQPAMLLCISAYLALAPLFQGFFIRSLQLRFSPGSSAYNSLWWMEVGELKNTFFPVWICTQYFSIPSLFLFSSLPLKSTKLGVFSAVRQPPLLC